MAYGRVEYDDLLDAFKCEICGQWYGGLSHHVYAKHKISIVEYRRRFGFNKNTAFVTLDERNKHRERERKAQKFKEINARGDTFFKKGDNRIQSYRRSQETLIRLKTELPKLGTKAQRQKRAKQRAIDKLNDK